MSSYSRPNLCRAELLRFTVSFCVSTCRIMYCNYSSVNVIHADLLGCVGLNSSGL